MSILRTKLLAAADHVASNQPEVFLRALAHRIAQSGDEKQVELFRQALEDSAMAAVAEADALEAEGKRPPLTLV
ncbi:hypothetical protein [Ovoidimarina sediminis]|uniref:hypothetical protein n=1 Tax=Ovoidimarina sediminis TaxID=3079856 RepID=UPI0029082CC1|nr:hypothetical protein [Rhodophyticola sp. MJ-SS7]MDU8945612.1 hypothetical protein [Rhodophyticola sp. MJ-SS7]